MNVSLTLISDFPLTTDKDLIFAELLIDGRRTTKSFKHNPV